jgi:hypothetical protein
MNEMWLVGRVFEDTQRQWEFMGIFESKEKAIAACTDWYDFVVGPVLLNERSPEETVEWKESLWPVSQRERTDGV